MSRQYSSKTAARILCALFVLISAAVAAAGPVESVQAQAPAQQASAGGVTDTWAVQISPGADPDQLALQMGAQNLGQIGALTDYYLFRIPGTDSELTAMADVFAASSQVVWFEQQVARQQSKRVIEDPVYLDQWHLVKANVEPAWNAGFTGTGVNIAIVDDGLEYTHPDLSAQYVPSGSYDFNDGDSDPIPGNFIYYPLPPYQLIGVLDTHGTSVAGVAAADYNGNTFATSCGVGVAYDAGLSGLRLIALPSTDAQEANALNYQWNINSIYNNSWGPIDGPDNDGNWQLAGPGPLTLSALQAGVTSGRNGKGSIYVWAAGNGLSDKDNVNYDGYANSRYTIAVGALGNDDTQAPYSEPGAAMLVTAPGGISGPNGIVTTDLLGHWGESSTDCTEGNFDGTSASAPIVSGVVALMLDANPNLGWRDVQNILARTAAQNDLTDADWDANPNLAGVQNNGAGLHVNHKYGFGLVDAAAAVAMANPATYVNLKRAASFSSGVVVPDIDNQNIPDNVFVDGAYDGVFSTYNVTQDINLEHVEVVFKSSENLNQEPPGTGGYRGDLRIVLTSPSGTVSVLSQPHGDSAPDYDNWKFMTVRNWGESSLGEWTLRVTDEKGGGVSVFDSWELILHGTGLTADVDVSISGDWKGSYVILPGNSVTPGYDRVIGGPVRVVGTGANFFTSERSVFAGTSFNETMGYPGDQLTTEYWFPWYDKKSMITRLLIGNPDINETAEVDVYIAGEFMGSYSILPYQSVTPGYDGVQTGPVRVVSKNNANGIAVPIFASERTVYGGNSFSEMMGYPGDRLTTEYWFTWYDKKSMSTFIVIGNPNAGVTAEVDVYIAGVWKGHYSIPPYKSVMPGYDLVQNGPVQVISTGANIIASERSVYAGKGFEEVMGYPGNRLTTEYFFPWYDKKGMITRILIGNPNVSGNAEVDVYIGGVWRAHYSIPPFGNVTPGYDGVIGGPVRVVSTGAKIFTSERSVFAGVSFNETLGYPWDQLTNEYWFPWYDKKTMITRVLIGTP